MNVPTAHIQAKHGDIAPIVLLPGDPLRAKYIAQTYLENPQCYNEVRGMLGYTGSYHGARVSIQGTGMGGPSMGIYAHELIHGYGVKHLIRIGTAGALQPHLKLKDLVLGISASYDGAYRDFQPGGTLVPTASFALLQQAYELAMQAKLPIHAGSILSSDAFYTKDGPEGLKPWKDHGILAVEMEAAALYLAAQRAGVQALCMLTISDLVFTGEAATPEERQTSFHAMMELALDTAAKVS